MTTGQVSGRYRFGGHGGPLFYGASNRVHNFSMNGLWGGNIPTFGTGVGQRCMTMSRNARYSEIVDGVMNRNGVSVDQGTRNDMLKFEGRDNLMARVVLRNAIQQGPYMDSARWSWHCSGQRIAHCVFDTFNGPVLVSRDYLDDLDSSGVSLGGNTRLNDIHIRNCLFRNILISPYASWVGNVLEIVLSAGINWQNVIQMHGVTIQDATRDEDSLYISIIRGVSPPGRQTLAWFMANYPANFSNITVQTGELFTAVPAAATDIDYTDIGTYYTPNTTANGVALTNANGSGSSSTSLTVDDSRWLEHPRSGAWGAKQLHLGGVGNVSYTGLNKSTHVVTLSSPQTWSDNAAINYPIPSGSTPNRGAVL